MKSETKGFVAFIVILGIIYLLVLLSFQNKEIEELQDVSNKLRKMPINSFTTTTVMISQEQCKKEWIQYRCPCLYTPGGTNEVQR